MSVVREKALRERIESDGFAIVPNLIDEDTVSRLLAAVAFNSESNSLRRRNEVFAIRNLLDASDQVRDVARSDAVLGPMEVAAGMKCFAVKATLFDKRTEANWKVPWHQDLTITVRERIPAKGFGPWSEKRGVVNVQPPRIVLEHMLAIRLHLDDCGESNGPLKVVPGSHRLGRLDQEAVLEFARTHPHVSCPVPRGGGLIMRPLLVHASSPASKPGRRRVLHLDYATSGLPDGLRWYHDPRALVPDAIGLTQRPER